MTIDLRFGDTIEQMKLIFCVVVYYTYIVVSHNTKKASVQQHRNIVFPFLFQLICDLI